MNNIIEVIKSSKKIGVTFHVSPDGDALGSAFALTSGLRKLNKEAYVLSKEEIPEDFNFLPLEEELIETSGKIADMTDCIIVLDCGSFDRISANFPDKDKKIKLLNIDHHKSNDMFGNFNYVDTSASCVGEIIYQLLMKLKLKLTQEISVCLYTSIITDTGSFKYPSTTSLTHKIAGDLINTGIDFNRIHKIIFENKKIERIKLYGEVIRTMTLYHNNKLCVMEISNDTLKNLNLPLNIDTSDIIAFAMQIDTVEVAALIKETDKGAKISLRSKAKVDVSKVAEVFGGGGHLRAAGLVMEKNMEASRNEIIDFLKNELV